MTFDGDATASTESRSDLARRGRRLLASGVATVSALAIVTGVPASAAEAREPVTHAAAETHVPVGTAAAQRCQPVADTFEQPQVPLIPDEMMWRNQDALDDLRAWTETFPGVRNSGYITLINEAMNRSTTLVWKGAPDTVQRQILDEAQRRHTPMSVQQRQYSKDDILRAMDQLYAIESGTGVLENFTSWAVGGLYIAFDGVSISGDYINAPAEGVCAADTALAQALTAIIGVTVRIEHEPVFFV
jgi:hypothetical protein